MRAVSKTFRLKPDTIATLQSLVASGQASSMTALIEQLVLNEKMRLDMRREEDQLEQAWASAMSLPEYRTEMQAIQNEFESADAESASQIR